MKGGSKSIAKSITVIFFLLNTAVKLNAQVLFPGPTVELPVGSGPYQVITADFNGDSRTDLAAVNYLGNKLSVWLGKGDGSMQDRIDYITGTNPISLAAGDFNGDTKLDLVTANHVSSSVSIFIGNGDGTFLNKIDYTSGQKPYFVVCGNLNTDNKLDLAVANYTGNSVSVLIGNGDGTFQSKADYMAGTNPVSAAVGDFNGDRYTDIAAANYNSSSISVLLGKGDGTFAAKVDYPTGLYPYSAITGDFNGDNIVDLANANYGFNNVSVLLGKGDGTFLHKNDYAAGVNPRSVTAADFNGDNKTDLAVANYNNASVSVLAGNGDGTFADKIDYPVGAAPYSVTTGDLNGDGNSDLGVTNYNSWTVSVLIGKGDGTFISRRDYATGPGPYYTAIGDFNNDRNKDLVVVNTGNTAGILLGKGDGTFLAKVDYITGAYSVAVETGDFNSDNKEDLAVANYNSGTVSILIGNGDGTFLNKVDYPAASYANSVVKGDFNMDNKTDLAVSGACVSVLLGNGDGTFRGKTDYPAGGRSIVAKDFNGDDMLDLAVVITNINKAGVLIGNGDGSFMGKVDYSTGGGPWSLIAADLNGDNKSDLATVNGLDNTISILFGNGDGTFMNKVNYAAGNRPQSLTAADFNGDGLPDIATANYGGHTVSVLLANPDGTFSGKIKYGTGLQPISVTNGDFNGDYNADIAVVNYSSSASVSILLNQRPPSHPSIDIILSNSSVNEDSPIGSLVGILSAAGSYPGQTFTFSELEDPDNKFVVSGNQVQVEFELDFEKAAAHSIKIRGTDNSNRTYDKEFIITINNVNEAPNDILLSNSSINENAPAGSVIGTLSAVDPDADTIFFFSELNDPDNKFIITGNELKLEGVLDFETAPSHLINIRTADTGGLVYNKEFTITVINVTGQVSGTVECNGIGIQNVAVKLLDEQGIPVTGLNETLTDSSGKYRFENIVQGNYQIMVVDPLGYAADENPKAVTITAGTASIINFILSYSVLSNAAEKWSYWKNQFDKVVKGKKANESPENLITYITTVQEHYTPHFGFFPFTELTDWQEVLSRSNIESIREQALAELAALVLNFGSLKLGQYMPITEDGRTAGEVLTYVSILLSNPEAAEEEFEQAWNLAQRANHGVDDKIKAGEVPPGNILFKGIDRNFSWGFGAPVSYELCNNYPNPFNPTTTIEFSLPEDVGNVKLSIYNTLGEELLNLVNEEKSIGYYKIMFNGSNLPSGVYFYRLRAGNFIETKKMILLR